MSRSVKGLLERALVHHDIGKHSIVVYKYRNDTYRVVRMYVAGRTQIELLHGTSSNCEIVAISLASGELELNNSAFKNMCNFVRNNLQSLLVAHYNIHICNSDRSIYRRKFISMLSRYTSPGNRSFEEELKERYGG